MSFYSKNLLNKTFLHDLPDEILYNIFSYLNLDDKINFLNSSDFLKPIINYYSVTKEPLYLKDVKSMENSSFIFPYVTIRILTEKFYNRFSFFIANKPEYNILIKYLNISSISISNINFLSLLVNLEFLSIYDTNVTNLFPLQKLYKLKEINCSFSKVKYLNSLRNLTNLQKLDFCNNKITNISPLSSLNKISNGLSICHLSSLNLSNTNVTNILPLNILYNLEKLNLSMTCINNISPLCSLYNLKLLNLFDTKIYDIIPLYSLTNLETLNLNITKIYSIFPLYRLKKLHTLKLGFTDIHNIYPLKYLTNLQNLDLRLCTNIYDFSSIQYLKKLTTLEI